MPREARRHQAGNLPSTVTSFVGRRLELAAARDRMASSRLVTLVGPGGVGKTRLAIEVGAQACRAFEDGVWLVDLASLADPTRLRQTVLSALQVRDQSARSPNERLVDHLRGRHLLLVLDNCEHLLEPCARLVADLLKEAPHLHVLATSREALGIAGEHLLPVPPLAVPVVPESGCDVGALQCVEAVALLIDRARAVRPGFVVAAANAAAVARLCALLDGVPLAIELAAVRLRSLSVDDVLGRLDDRFALLTGGDRSAEPRQQTLRALIDWSYDLCTPDEQLLWARLSVFAGTFDLAAAEAVCAGEGLARSAIIDVLDHLVGKSIVISEASGPRLRNRMLVSVRDYGGQLLRPEQHDDLRRRHRNHYLERARGMSAGWCGPGQAEALARMRDDHPNLRAALQWSLARPAEANVGAELAAELRWHWVVGGLLSEGRRWLDQALEAATEPTRERSAALWVAAWVSLVQGERAVGLARLEEGAALASEIGDEPAAAHCAQWQGIYALFSEDTEEAAVYLQRSVALHGVCGDAAGALFALFQLAVSRAYSGDLAAAQRTCDEGLRRSAGHGERWARAYHHWASAIVAWHRGDHDTVEHQGRLALEIEREFEDGICAALVLEVLACSAAARDDHDAAAHLLGAAHAVWTGMGTTARAFGPMGTDHEVLTGQVRTALGDARFEEQRAKTASLPIERAIAFGLGGPTAPETAATPAAADSPLTRREEEVAALVAEGLTNKAIAEQLVVSVRTVEGHIERSKNKLGYSSRVQVAAWVTARRADRVRTPVGS
jgi:predicted ATPase/DNA-binding CsgD family transcriptional regulator